MEDIVYYAFCAMALLGALGVIVVRGYVNSAMCMLVSVLGVCGLLALMGAYFLAFVTLSVYAGAVLVLFVFVVMLVGDSGDNSSFWKKIGLLALWILAGIFVASIEPWLAKHGAPSAMPENSPLALAKNYGLELFSQFMLPFQVAGFLLLAAITGVSVIGKHKRARSQGEPSN